ncbi:MAG TPA: dTDP-4-dehydrorhamnose reductase [Bryobacteraceae bacterium]|nr:dTDP-4-dehydrorhamnose reductase [Bryobacteraceae bacterium]
MGRKIVILGNAGQLGVELVSQLSERGYDVTGWDKGEVDITDAEATERSLASIDPEVVINAAAYNQVDVAEREPLAAFEVNALAVRSVAVACRQLDARLIHFSTDYVFDGRAGRTYTEEDHTHPLGAYGVSKLAGELYAQAYLEQPLIIRTSGVFGPGGLRTARGNFVELMLRLGAGQQPIRVVEDHVASPTYAPALANRTIELMERNQTGVFHVGGGTPISWFEYARLIFEVAGMKPELRPTNEREYRSMARRPKFSALSNARMEAAGLAPMPPLRQCIEEYFQIRRRMVSEAQA